VRRNCSETGSALEISKEVEGEIFEPPPGFGSRQSNSFGHLSAHRDCHASKDVLDACSNSGFNAIKIFGCFTKSIISRCLLVNQDFESAEAQQMLKAFT